MVFLQFPAKLTDEETMLQAKYAKLRKKKKQLAEAKNNAAKTGTGTTGTLTDTSNEKPLDRVGGRERNNPTGLNAPLAPNSSATPKDAKEAAKKTYSLRCDCCDSKVSGKRKDRKSSWI